MKPLVAVTCDRRDGAAAPEGPRVRPKRAEVFVGEAVVARLRAAGAHVVLLPPGDPEVVERLRPDGVVITGGSFDIHPRHYGQAVTARLDRVEEDRTLLELALARACVARGAPLLGVCGGMQAMAVAMGGTLHQDVPGHEQASDPATPAHPIAADARWAELFGGAVNSTHHQAVDDPGPFAVVGRAPDGLVEAISLPGQRFCVGVQWHPELLDGRLFAALVSACSR